MSTLRLIVTGAALLGANPKAGDRWKMLAWQLSGSLGEKREGTQKR